MMEYITDKRKKLVAYLGSHEDEQLSAYDICKALANENISKSAIYRNLALLEEKGLLKKYAKENTKELYYQYIGSNQCKDSIHLCCKKCGKSIHLDKKQTDILLKGTLDTTGFLINKQETIIYGLCKNCRI